MSRSSYAHCYLYGIILLALLFVATGCKKSELVGTWESIDQQGGLANILEIEADGTLRSILLARVERGYRLKDDMLIMTGDVDKNGVPKEVDDKQLTKYRYELKGNTLKLTAIEKQETMELQRVDENGKPVTGEGLSGRWAYKHPTGQTATFRFTPEGIVYFRLRLPGATTNEYKVKRDQVTLTRDDKVVQTATYRLDSGILILAMELGKEVKEMRYARVQ